MSNDKQFDLIITIVNRGFADDVVDAARSAGAEGGTIMYGRGTGVHEHVKFFGITIEPEKEVVLILILSEKKQAVMEAICNKAGLLTPGKGISFSMPVDDAVGIVHLLNNQNKKIDE